MKNLLVLLLCLAPFFAIAQNVGVNDDGTAPFSGAILDVKSSDKGMLIPRLETTAVTTPTEGMIIFQPSDQAFYFYKSSTWEKINSGVTTGGSFETTSNNLIRSTGSAVDSEDLLIGSTTVPGYQLITDKLFHYDQSSGAFRGGKLTNSNVWSPINTGNNSFAYGENVKADGSSAIALGQDIDLDAGSTPFAIGLRDTVYASNGSGALGYENHVSGFNGNIAIGSNNEISNTASNGAVAIGYKSKVTADSGAVAIGLGVQAYVDGSVVVGRYNSAPYPSDLAFAVGIGNEPYDSNNPRADGLVVRGNGYIGMNENQPTDVLQIRNTFRKPNEGISIAGDEQNEHVHILMNNKNLGGQQYGLLSTGGNSGLGQGKFIIRNVLKGQELFTIDSIGNLGLRTIDPMDDLHINLLDGDNFGGITVEGGTSSKETHLILDSETNNGKSFLIGSTGNGASIGAKKFVIRDMIAAEERLVISGVGKVGIGNHSPIWTLDVNAKGDINDGLRLAGSPTTSNVQVRLENNANNGHHYTALTTGEGSSYGDGKFLIRDATENRTRLAITDIGNVGIGELDPVSKLSIKTNSIINDGIELIGDPATRHLQFRFENNAANAHHYNLLTTGGTTPFGAGKFILRDITTTTDRMTLDSLGNFGFGLGSPAERVHVNGAIVVDTAFTNTPGTIQFKNNEFRGYDGTSWVSLGSATGAGTTFLEDADGDTEINVEDTPDADVIRMKLNNTLSFAFKQEPGSSARQTFLNNGNNTIISNKDDQSNTDLNNIIVGANAALNHSHSKQNVYIGVGAAKTSDSEYDVAIGYQAMFDSEKPDPGNVAIGALTMQSLNSDLAGISSLAIGYKAGKDAQRGGFFIGESAGEKNQGNGNSYIGNHAGKGVITGTLNTFVGYKASQTQTGVLHTTIVGAVAGDGVGSESTVMGVYAGNDGTTDAQKSTLIGFAAGQNTTGEQNTFVGHNAGNANTAGKYNTFLGADAGTVQASGDKNTFIGAFSGKTSTAGHSNTMLGYDTYMPVGLAYTNASALGAYSSLHGSHTVTIGGTGILDIGGYSSWSNLSDGRFKENVKNNVPGLDFINKLRPVTYNLNTDAIVDHIGMPNKVKHEADNQAGLQLKAKETQTGFIAQEVEQAANEAGFNFSGVLTPDNNKDTYRLRYAEFVVPLVKAVQEQQAQIESLQAQIDLLIKQIDKK